MPRKPSNSRPARWASACADAEAALNTLLELQQEYEAWRDNLPENLSQSAIGEKLETICDLDIQSAIDTISEAAEADLPRGFGKD